MPTESAAGPLAGPDRRWIRLFRDGSAGQRDLLGGKGANLCEMTNLGLPVPPGFIVTTEACRAYLAAGGEVPADLWSELHAALAALEQEMGQRFGDAEHPLLLSVRSGAKFSMPGMMDTVLNLGLTHSTLLGLARQGGERFALDCRRRLLQMFGEVVLGGDAAAFEEALTDARRRAGVRHDHELDPAAMRELVVRYETIITARGTAMPDDPFEQLRLAVLAVFRSWNTERARAYRRSNQIPDDLGTAVNIQAMVFGNVGADSASGVAFTRDPSTGEAVLFGEYLVNAQGEDVVAGIRTPQPLAQLATDSAFAPAAAELDRLARTLETHYRDMQDLEFTIERGRLWLLQTRTGKRTAQAAVTIALAMANEALIDRATAVRRVEPAQFDILLHPRLDETRPLTVLATGLPASPGAATGRVVFVPLEARQRGERGEAVILVRRETAADDFPGMERSAGILTAHGGMTSHAAVVARGIGKPAVTGAGALEINEAERYFMVGATRVNDGDELTLDGSTGRIIRGRVPTIAPTLTDEMLTLLAWADTFRRMEVRANADTPGDARRAREFGATGIGLCRTEHMFFGEERINAVREMILADTDSERERALAKLEPFQQADFVAIFREMDGLPVTIRLLDPPLHEFLPHGTEEIARLATRLGLPVATVEAKIDAHREDNPMLGNRGCRLGMTFPALTRMQARAIFRAARECVAAGVTVEPEIMVPLVVDAEELRRQRQEIEQTAAAVFATPGPTVSYRIGTMIELPRAALLADRLAVYADFFSFGTNDLTQTTMGLSRDDAGQFLPRYVAERVFANDPFQVLDRDGVGQLIALGTERGRRARPDLEVGICGEHGGEPSSIMYFHEIGMDYVSCSPFRVPIARLTAAHAALGPIARDV